ncbi:hypothetical protein KSP35_01140 [Aquihabitans sp. G128]|uniref:hypothetical protein n=1 Tax=Aquihabitans sp. G128 TaxID=2849779 RepID=UPI001C236A96|nr:hypothetical protein [Aquihabitans sp. G128]QXC61484.1 hypothetical protein KSP35_01140 [Aquihabitans sp. G128]
MTEAHEVSFPRWFAALVPRLGTVVRCHLPGSPVDARRRELVSAVVAGAAGSGPLARLHADWHDVLGPAELTEVDDEVLSWVVAAVAPRPELDPVDLPAEVTPQVRRALVALVAHGVVAAATADRAGALALRLVGQLPRDPRAAAGDLAALAVGVPVSIPPVAFGAVVGVLGRLAPPPAAVEVGDDPNLLTQLLAEILPTWLGSAWGRTLVARLPVEVPVAVRSGLTGATVRVGRGRVRVANGIGDDIWALFDGEIDALLRAGSSSLSRELRSARLRR